MSNLPSLYNITSAMLALMESETTEPAEIEAAFGALQEKDNRIAHFRADLKGEIAKFKAEEKRLSERRKAMENLVDRLEGYIQDSMERLEIEEVTTGTFKISLQNSAPALETVDKELTPAGYKIIVPATWEPDLARIKEDLKAGKTVPGYRLKKGRHIRIR